MIEKRRLKPLFVLSSIGLLCLDGEAAWIYSTSKILDGIVLSPSDSRIICYIKTESGALEYFTSIDKALEVASKRAAKDQIFLKPTKSFSGDKFKKAVVEQNHVLNENDVLPCLGMLTNIGMDDKKTPIGLIPQMTIITRLFQIGKKAL